MDRQDGSTVAPRWYPRRWFSALTLAVCCCGAVPVAARAENLYQAFAAAYAVNPLLGAERAAVRVSAQDKAIAETGYAPALSSTSDFGYHDEKGHAPGNPSNEASRARTQTSMRPAKRCGTSSRRSFSLSSRPTWTCCATRRPSTCAAATWRCWAFARNRRASNSRSAARPAPCWRTPSFPSSFPTEVRARSKRGGGSATSYRPCPSSPPRSRRRTPGPVRCSAGRCSIRRWARR